MPNVLILPRSADYSEEVWMEIRDKAISILQSFFFDGIIPRNAVSDVEEDESEVGDEFEQYDSEEKVSGLELSVVEQSNDDILASPESSQKQVISQSKDSTSQQRSLSLSQNISTKPEGSTPKSEGRRSRSGKKAKKRHAARQKSLHKSDDPSTLEKESTSHREDDTAMSGTDHASSRGPSPEDSRSRKTPKEPMHGSSSDQLIKSSKNLNVQSCEILKDGFVIALYARDRPALHVSRQRLKGGGWFLDTMSNVTKRDPAAQFLVVYRSKVYYSCFLFFFFSFLYLL